MEPGHAGFLVWPEHVLQISQRRAWDCGLAALLPGVLAPGTGLHLPAGLLECGIEKSRLRVADTITPVMLLWRTVEQHLLQLLNRADVKQGGLAIFEASMTLA